MTTDVDRQFARWQAQRIRDHHVSRGRDPDAPEFHISDKVSYLEALYRGLLCECDFAELLDLPRHDRLDEWSDGGVDFPLRLQINGVIEARVAQVKCKSCPDWSTWEHWASAGTHLRVPCRELDDKKLYIAGVYWEDSDTAVAVGWTWGATIRKHRDVRPPLKNGNVYNNFYPFGKLRSFAQLKDRQAVG
jgi:hypothetical protein